MACLITKRGKWYRKIKLDLWGHYATHARARFSYKRKVDNTISYWMRLEKAQKKFKRYIKRKYVFRLWNRPRFVRYKKLKPNYIRPRYLRNFYIILKKKTFLKYIKISMKGKLVRGFVSTYLGYLEARLFVIVYRLNIVNNIFMVKSLINLGVFSVNLKKKTHINTRLQLGDFLHVTKNWNKVLKYDIALRLRRKMVLRNINNFYSNFIQLFFLFFKVYNIKNIHYPIRIDLYRAIDFIGPLR